MKTFPQQRSTSLHRFANLGAKERVTEELDLSNKDADTTGFLQGNSESLQNDQKSQLHPSNR